MATHYLGSRGPVEIAAMPLRYAGNALDKLRREREDDSRDAEIDALAGHVAKLSEEMAERMATEGSERQAIEGSAL